MGNIRSLVNIFNLFDPLHEVGFTIFMRLKGHSMAIISVVFLIGINIFMRLKRGLVAMTSLFLLIGFYYCYEFGNIYLFEFEKIFDCYDFVYLFIWFGQFHDVNFFCYSYWFSTIGGPFIKLNSL